VILSTPIVCRVLVIINISIILHGHTKKLLETFVRMANIIKRDKVTVNIQNILYCSVIFHVWRCSCTLAPVRRSFFAVGWQSLLCVTSGCLLDKIDPLACTVPQWRHILGLFLYIQHEKLWLNLVSYDFYSKEEHNMTCFRNRRWEEWLESPS